MRFHCYEAIGVAIGEAGNVKAADHLIEDILYWKFQYPDIRGATDEWETVVNPYHLPKIRCWMHIIESNPALFERLAAALNVQLRLGGVYIADTDLFQRDVTRFLNADIRPIYFVAKQLLRTLPVYFNEVGAEGELRAVSTQIDEICGRRDTLMHFLRKQVHAESSNRLVAFSRAVLRYWMTLDPTGPRAVSLRRTRWRAVRDEREWAAGPHDVLLAAPAPPASAAAGPRRGRSTSLARRWRSRRAASAPASGTRRRTATAATRTPAAVARRRVALLVRTHQLLAQKYSLSADDIGTAVARDLQLDGRMRAPVRGGPGALAGAPGPAHARRACSTPALTVLEELKAIILSPAPASATENIYQKRHIAAGIPSIYGNYTEPKFDALGLSFRVENLVGRLLDDVVAEGIEPYVTRDSLRRMATAIRRFERALAADGVDSRALGANLAMLEASFAQRNFTFRQYQNVFQFLANSVTELSRPRSSATTRCCTPCSSTTRGSARRAACPSTRSPRWCCARCSSRRSACRPSTATCRRRCARSRCSTAASTAAALTRMMNYDPERLVSPIHKPKRGTDDQMTLGFKGLGPQADGRLRPPRARGLHPHHRALRRHAGHVVPAALRRHHRAASARRSARSSGRPACAWATRAGCCCSPSAPARPISMPGLMTTFVNVGLNDELAEAFAARPETSWAAWDCYRRFLQSWAMSSGIDRDFFDAIMTEFKARYGVGQKLDFTPEQMREIAFAYKSRARDQGVVFVDDPFRQVIACIRKVLESWDSAPARVYRQYIGVAEEWGTAVVVQRMVFGNLSRESGSGVTFTRNPLEPHSRQVRLFGDFAVRSQGEDLVGGLVFPWPISEAQRLGSPTYRGTEHSLERDFPEIYQQLLAVARDLVGEREYDPQEIEFTFESPAASDLYILQKRRPCRSRPATPPTSTPRRPTSGRRSLSAWAWPAAPTRAGWPSTPTRSTAWRRRPPTSPSSCSGPTRCPRTSP